MSQALLLLLGGLCLQSAAAGSHTFRAFYSSLSDPIPALPQFSAVGYVDDVPISGYTSWSQKVEPKAEWMKHEGPEYWEGQTQIQKGAEQSMRANVKIAMSRVNQTRGLHSFQLMYGCEMSDDGLSSGGLFQFSYDGQDFISLDKDRLTWVAAMDPAQITQQRWNQERSIAERDKHYLEQECIEWLKKYLQYGKEALQPVRPEVKMSHRKSGNSNTLSCFVYGFYPREIEVKWVRNGVEMAAKFVPKILPNPDGTYQIRTSLDVPEGEEEMHTCQVDHSSLKEVLTERYEKPASIIGVIAAVGLVILVAAGAVIGFVIWKKRSGRGGDYTAASRGPGNVDSSSSNASA